jgi:hypothetical protein
MAAAAAAAAAVGQREDGACKLHVTRASFPMVAFSRGGRLLCYIKCGRANLENGLLRALEYVTFPVSKPKLFEPTCDIAAARCLACGVANTHAPGPLYVKFYHD